MPSDEKPAEQTTVWSRLWGYWKLLSYFDNFPHNFRREIEHLQVENEELRSELRIANSYYAAHEHE